MLTSHFIFKFHLMLLSLLFDLVSHVFLCFLHSFPIPARFISQLLFLVILSAFSVLQFSYLCLLFTLLLS